VVRVYLFVSRILPLLALVCLRAAAAAPDTRLDPLLHGVEARYNRAQSLKLDFAESYSVARRPTQVERGVLFLRKPGKMRWDYAAPAGKVFVSDGKNVFLYTPDNHRLEKSKLKESEDLRAPLAFLLGKLNFWKEFKSFTSRAEGDATWVSATPNSDQMAYTQVDFLITPDYVIRRVRITGQDRSILEFTFTNEQLNAPVAPTLFAFTPPPGTEIIEDKESADNPVRTRP
jgi:outer membrane lipoprotein carrier protein